MAYLLSLTPFMPNVFKYTPIDTALIPHICVLVTKLAVLVSTNTFIKSVSALINTACTCLDTSAISEPSPGSVSRRAPHSWPSAGQQHLWAPSSWSCLWWGTGWRWHSSAFAERTTALPLRLLERSPEPRTAGEMLLPGSTCSRCWWFVAAGASLWAGRWQVPSRGSRT